MLYILLGDIHLRICEGHSSTSSRKPPRIRTSPSWSIGTSSTTFRSRKIVAPRLRISDEDQGDSYSEKIGSDYRNKEIKILILPVRARMRTVDSSAALLTARMCQIVSINRRILLFLAKAEVIFGHFLTRELTRDASPLTRISL